MSVFGEWVREWVVVSGEWVREWIREMLSGIEGWDEVGRDFLGSCFIECFLGCFLGVG